MQRTAACSGCYPDPNVLCEAGLEQVVRISRDPSLEQLLDALKTGLSPTGLRKEMPTLNVNKPCPIRISVLVNSGPVPE